MTLEENFIIDQFIPFDYKQVREKAGRNKDDDDDTSPLVPWLP